MRTVAELKRLMSRRVEQGEAGENKIAAVVARLAEQHYLDDRAFASTYTRLRQENQSFGKRRVQQELTRKGVQSELVASTLRPPMRRSTKGSWFGAMWPASGLRSPKTRRRLRAWSAAWWVRDFRSPSSLRC